MDYDLRGRVALVTGAASGIGGATTELFAAMGARVVASDVDADRGAATVTDLTEAGHEVAFMAADITDGEAVAALVAFTVDTYGRLDCAANCAGIGGGDAVTHQYPDDRWDQIISTDLRGTWLAMRRELAAMLAQGEGGTSLVAQAMRWSHRRFRLSAGTSHLQRAILQPSCQLRGDCGSPRLGASDDVCPRAAPGRRRHPRAA
jgi:NAD(P)-dependent dehydrogenase (short-subunit alcohol dehydrogenase family)